MAENGVVAEAPARESPSGNRVLVSNKRPLFSYAAITKKLLHEHEEVYLSALGMAMSTVVAVAELLTSEGLVVQASIKTWMEEIVDAGRPKPIHKAKLEVVLKKSGDFDSIMAAQQAEKAKHGEEGEGEHAEEEEDEEEAA